MKKRCLVLPIIFDLQDLEQLHFLAWSYKADEKIAFNWTKKRKHYPRILILFFLISRLFNSSTLIFFPYLNPMEYRETQMTVWSYNHQCQLFNSDFWVWINHPVPTFDIWPSINYILLLIMLLKQKHSSWCYSALPCSHNNPHCFLQYDPRDHPIRWKVAPPFLA